MLVLGRKVGETICINDNIVVTVVSVDGHRIRLGIAAPREVHIRRGELSEEPVVVAAKARKQKELSHAAGHSLSAH